MRVFGAVLIVLVAYGCNRVPPLAHTHASAEAAASAVLEALAASNRTALDELVLSEQEFKDHVWPHLPSARPERNMPFSYVWGDLRQKSQASLGQLVRQFSGRHLRVERVAFSGETYYPDARVHREARVTVRDAAGEVSEIRICGSLIEKNGRWKVFSYVVDD